MNKIDQLGNYFKSSNLQEALDQLYQVYLGACAICNGDRELEENCKKYITEQVGDCLGER